MAKKKIVVDKENDKVQVSNMDERLEKQLAFSLEIDKVKNIFRQTYLSDKNRKENDASEVDR